MAPAPLLGHIPYTWDMDPVLFLGYASCTLWDPVAPGLGRYLLYIVLSHEFSDLSACQARVIMGAFLLPLPPAHHLPEKSLSLSSVTASVYDWDSDYAWDWGFLAVCLLPAEPEALGQDCLHCGPRCVIFLSCLPQAPLQ